MRYDVVVAGGGASGIAAAITAANRGLRVAIIEKNDRIGKKLLSTGNGKCNLASTLAMQDRYNTNAVEATFNRVPLLRILDFFANLGMAIRYDDGRIYPYSNQASTVLNTLRKGLNAANVTLLCNTQLLRIRYTNHFVLDTDNGTIECPKLIFATGSTAGGGTDSLHLLEDLGHSITACRPALVPLLTDTTYLKGLRGIRADVQATLLADGKAVQSVCDEVLFKDNGITGSAVFTLSSRIARLRDVSDFKIALDFAPDYSNAQLAAIIEGKMGLEGLFHKEIAANIVRYASNNCPKGISGLTCAIKRFIIDIKQASAYSLAQVVSGGLDNFAFDFCTMQSKLCKGLFAVGEALDVDGDCGGFNLMWAWAGGILAGESC